MLLRSDLEAAPDAPASVEASEESYVSGVKCLAKHFLKGLDEWTDFDKEKDWKESELGEALYDRCSAAIPEELKQALTGAQVGIAAHVAYQAYMAPKK